MTKFGHLQRLRATNPPEVSFILHLRHHGKINWEDQDIEFAKYYGIPNCCRDFFIKLRKLGLTPYKFMLDTFGRDTKPEVGYVRCLQCRKGGDTHERENHTYHN